MQPNVPYRSTPRMAAMSAYGTKRTGRDEERMSAFEGKADMTQGQRHVCFDPGAEVAPATLL
jgi:hypothetical protein